MPVFEAILRIARGNETVTPERIAQEALLVRGLVACPTCGVAAGDRCRGSSGTMAFPHEARVAAALEG